MRLNDAPLATNLECLCRASPPDAHSQLAGPAVGEQVCRGCADSLNAWAAAPLGGEGLVGLRQLPAPQPVHVGQRSGRRTAQACKKARETSHSTKTSQRTVNPGAGVPAMHEPASLRGQQQWGEVVTVMRCKLKVGSQQRSLVFEHSTHPTLLVTCGAVDVGNALSGAVRLGQRCHCLGQLLPQVTAWQRGGRPITIVTGNAWC